MVRDRSHSYTQPVVRERALPFLEHSAEATTACLFAMVQGNLLTLTLSHWVIASQTGVLAGALTAIAIALSRVQRPWIISLVLGLLTTVADYFAHEGMIGPFFLEALITGIGAGLLCLIVQKLWTFIHERRVES